jgi:hypothetical protein
VPARDDSGQGKKASERVTASHPGEHKGREKSGYGKEVVGKGHSRPREHRGTDKLGQRKEANERGAHSLESTERETSQDKTRKQTNRALTIWRCQQRENQDTRREQANKRNSPTGKCRGGNRSGHGKDSSK